MARGLLLLSLLGLVLLSFGGYGHALPSTAPDSVMHQEDGKWLPSFKNDVTKAENFGELDTDEDDDVPIVVPDDDDDVDTGDVNGEEGEEISIKDLSDEDLKQYLKLEEQIFLAQTGFARIGRLVTHYYSTMGSYRNAVQDFNLLRPANVRVINQGYSGFLGPNRAATITVRTGYPSSRTTLEIRGPSVVRVFHYI